MTIFNELSLCDPIEPLRIEQLHSQRVVINQLWPESEKTWGSYVTDSPYPSLAAIRSPTSQTPKALNGRGAWCKLLSIFLILQDSNYLPRFFSLSN
jgi:hypothetical protein